MYTQDYFHKRSVKNYVFSRQDIYNKIFTILWVPPSACDKNAKAEISTKAKQWS